MAVDPIKGRYGNVRTKKKAVMQLMAEEPHLTIAEVAKKIGCHIDSAYKAARESQHTASPTLARLVKLEAKFKTLEAMMLKVLAAKGIGHQKSDFGLK